MARKIYPYSLNRKDAKVAGVCSTIGAIAGIDRRSFGSRSSPRRSSPASCGPSSLMPRSGFT